MVADAISHAVLPGIVIAYLVGQSLENWLILPAAAVFGMFTTVLIETLQQKTNLSFETAIGFVFTALFAIGVILLSLFAGQIHLDQDCILYGEIAYIPLHLFTLSNDVTLGPTGLWVAVFLFIIVFVFIKLFYRQLFISTFDPHYASVLGEKTSLWNHLLMALVSLTTVLAFESVGTIMVITLLVGTPATAYLISTRLFTMQLLAILLGITASAIGYYLAAYLDTSISAAISTVIGIQFAIAFIYKRVSN